ncbi:MAG: hypothetical protein WD313_04195 [Acidimicrobiia bacterium]
MRVFRFVVLIFAMVVAVAPMASAGGSWMDTPDEYVEPGETVEFVGYVGAENADDGPWYAFLNTGGAIVALGPVTIETTGLGGYLSHRVYLRFTVPSTMTTGSYGISVQNGPEFSEDRTEFLGDLVGAVVEVGTVQTPSYYPWPIDEPLVASLPAHAVMAGPDWEITVGEIRHGIYPKCQWGCLLDPTVLRREDVTIVDAPPSWATTIAPPTTTPPSTTTTVMSIAAVGSGTTTADVRADEVPQDAGNDIVLMTAGVLLAIAVSFVAAALSRDAQSASIPEPRVQEDDLFEPTNV